MVGRDALCRQYSRDTRRWSRRLCENGGCKIAAGQVGRPVGLLRQHMAKPNYQFEKRRREMDKKAKKAEKLKRKDAPDSPAEPEAPAAEV